MRILLACEGALERYGVCVFLLQWLHGIKEAFPNAQVTMYFRPGMRDKALKEEYESLGAKVVLGNLPEQGSVINKNNRKKIQSDIRKILTSDQFDVVHIHTSIFGFPCIVLYEAVRAKVPIRIVHSHGALYHEKTNAKRLLYGFLRMYILNIATVYAGCSKNAGVYMFGEKAVESPKWKVIKNTIDAKQYAFNLALRTEYRKKAKVHDEEVLLGAVGHLSAIKNHSFLLDVMEKLDGFRVKLIILGEGEIRSNLEKKRNRLGLEDVVFMPGKSDDIPGWLSAMDCFLMPSLSEGLPISAVEAQANGLYCILSDRITNEVNISTTVYYLPIDQGPDVWVETIKSLHLEKLYNRGLGPDNVRHGGFDISECEKYVRHLYDQNQ